MGVSWRHPVRRRRRGRGWLCVLLLLSLTSLGAAPAPSPRAAGPDDARADSPAAGAEAASPPGHAARERAIDWAQRAWRVHVAVLPPGNARLWSDVAKLGQQLAQEQLRRAFVQLFLHMPLGCGIGTPASMLAKNPAWMARLEDSVQAYTATATTFDADGTVRIDAELPFEGGRAQLGALAWQLWQQALKQPHKRTGAGLSPAAPSMPAATATAAPANQPTGIVVQALGLGMAPALWPRIFDARGRELYGPGSLRPDAFVARGVASLHASVASASHDPRVSERALVLPAQAIVPGCGSDVVLGDAAARLLRQYPALLQEGRVAFVLEAAVDDPTPRGLAEKHSYEHIKLRK